MKTPVGMDPDCGEVLPVSEHTVPAQGLKQEQQITALAFVWFSRKTNNESAALSKS